MSPRPFVDVYQGFLDDPSRVLLVLFGVFALVLVALAVFVIQNRRMRQALELQSARARERAIARLKPTPEEIALIDHLVQSINDPATRGHLVLTNQNTFNHYATRVVASGGATDAQMAALRLRLGFARSNTERVVTTTAILPAGLRLFVVQRETKKFYAIVRATTAEGLVVHIEDSNVIAPGPGTELRCYFNVKNGTFHFNTNVQGLDGQTMRLAHSEKISRDQRRKYYRARTTMQARVGVAGSAETPAPTQMIDISGGGASLQNPGLRFNPGDDVLVQFKTPDDQEYRIVAEVRRLSHGGRVLHAVFGPMSDTTRDRLIAFVLSLRRPQRGPVLAQPVQKPPADPG
jgi:c-di-GMP-binding flagellar brake protein YcgR